MKQSALEYKLRKNTRPVVVEFWAPWCSPCKMMAPYLKKAEKEFSGRVDLWRINADEEQNLQFFGRIGAHNNEAHAVVATLLCRHLYKPCSR